MKTIAIIFPQLKRKLKGNSKYVWTGTETVATVAAIDEFLETKDELVADPEITVIYIKWQNHPRPVVSILYF